MESKSTAVRASVKQCQTYDIIAPRLIGMAASDQAAIDHTMIELDGTDNKSHLGANATGRQPGSCQSGRCIAR